MILNLAEGTQDLPQSCDLLILGAGPAGISLALSLSRAQPALKIVLAEAGGYSMPDAEGLDLYQGESRGSANYSLVGSRLRFLGGTSGHWGGWCRPLDEVDFSPRPQAGSTGWPISLEELHPYYQQAHPWLELSSDDYSCANLSEKLRGQLLDFSDSPWFRNRMFRFSPPTRFGSRYRDDLANSENIQVILNAAALDYRFDGPRLSEVSLGGLHGLRHKIRAERFVFAMGGIESARHLLLLREQGWQAAGVRSPLLGRGFADHFGMHGGILELRSGLMYERTVDDSGPVMPIISPTPEALAREDWNNCCMLLEMQPLVEGLPAGYSTHQSLGLAGADSWRYRALLILEPRFNEASRVELATDRDALGLPRVRLFWEIDPRDYQSGARIYQRFSSEMGRLGYGRGQIKEQDLSQLPRRANGVNHHLGTTRMGLDPASSVVDPQLKVHGSENLWVLSSAVFPSAGFSNPTLTIVALGQRLGEQLLAGVPA